LKPGGRLAASHILLAQCAVPLEDCIAMGMLDGLWHLLNFFAPALAVGALAAGLTKLVWYRELKTVTWARLAAWAVVTGAGVLVAGLVLTGRDGKMATYGAMVVGIALSLWWAAFGPHRG
jgi:hypothetical protein